MTGPFKRLPLLLLRNSNGLSGRLRSRRAGRLLAFGIIAASIQFLPPPPCSGASSGWKPICADDLAVSAVSIGYPDADAAILLREGELDDEMSEGTSLKIYVRMKVFTERGRRYGDVQLPYRLDLGKIVDVHARTVRPDGKAVEVERRDIFDKLLITSGRNIWRAKTFSMPSVEPGSIIEYRYRQVYPAGFRYFELDLQSDLFIKQLSYRVKPERSSSLDVRWVAFNSNDPADFTPKWNGAYNIKAENISPFRREPLMPPELAVKAWGWIYYSKGTDTDPDKYWREYGQHMYEESMFESRPSATVRAVVDTITLGDTTPHEKIASIYSYVHREIKPVDESDVKADHLKRNADADQTLRRRYGTQTDINSLFISMLRAAGLDARVAELTTRDENMFHRAFPDAFQFNSEITAVAGPDSKFEFYDPGSRYCPLGLLAWEKQGVPALISDKDKPSFVTTPVAPGAENREDRTMTVAPAPDGRLAVRAELQLTGLKAVDFRSSSAGHPVADPLIALIENVNDPPPTGAESPTINVSSSDEPGPVSLSYSFAASSFAPPTERRLLLRPALMGRKGDILFSSATRINKVYFRYPWSERDKVTIEVPEGFEPEQLPDAINIDIGAATYRSAYRREGSKVVFERALSINGISFDVDEYQTLKSFFDRVHQADQSVLSFKR